MNKWINVCVSVDWMFNLSFREAVTQDRYNCLFNLSLMHGAMSAFTNYSPGFDLWQSGLFNLLNPGSKWTSSAFSMGYSTKCHWSLCAAVCATNALALLPRFEGQLLPILNAEWLSLLGLQRWTPTWPEGLCGVFAACALTARRVQNVRVFYGGFLRDACVSSRCQSITLKQRCS